MPRNVLGGLIQAASPITDPATPIDTIRRPRSTRTSRSIEEAGRRGVQILGLQEIFNGPYFCPSQDAHWYDIAEPVPGPTTELMAQYAKKYQMAMVVPVYEREQAGVYYNTAAVYDSDGSYLGKYRKNHIPHTSGFWEKYFFKPGNLGYPVFKTRFATIGVYICYDRHFPEGARLLGLNGAEIVFNPSATVAGLSQYLWKLEQPAHAVANGYFMACSNRVGTEAPWNIGRFYGSSYFVDPRGNFLAMGSEDKDELVVAEMDLDMIEEVRRVWQFYRDRRPDSYGADGGAAAMSLLIKNGTIVTATDLYAGDVLVEGETHLDDRHLARHAGRPRHRRQPASTCLPGGIDVHTHLDMPFGGTTSADDFESGTIAAAHGGTTTIVDFAIQYRGQTLHHAWETWMKKAEGKAAIDYGFHMIVTELTDQVELEMDALVRQGVTSFKLFMAYPGVFMLDDASIFRALLRTGQERRHDLHARRERRRHRRAGEAGAGRGQDGAEVSRADPPGAGRSRGHAPRDRARRDRRRADLHRPPLGGRGAGDGHRGARPRPAGVRRDLSAVPVPVLRQLRGAGLRRRQVRDEPAAARRRRRRTGSGAASPSTTCRRSPPTTARSA